jgi:hypothetical protein
MINRRSVLSGTALGSALAALTSQPALEARGEEALQGNSDRVNVSIDTSGIISSINALRAEVRRQDSFWEIELVRGQIVTFLRQTGKYPDYIEVGTDVWHQVYDWHVRYQQPLQITRSSEGRYTILLYSTQVIMRTELAASYIGQAYDNR